MKDGSPLLSANRVGAPPLCTIASNGPGIGFLQILAEGFSREFWQEL